MCIIIIQPIGLILRLAATESVYMVPCMKWRKPGGSLACSFSRLTNVWQDFGRRLQRKASGVFGMPDERARCSFFESAAWAGDFPQIIARKHI
ncbi:MAG TPA: hypothetical protein VMZ49_10780 [Patescibacteria group bacterium]|nr:hypothetical protein [Patescibacteria group bacterium]